MGGSVVTSLGSVGFAVGGFASVTIGAIVGGSVA